MLAFVTLFVAVFFAVGWFGPMAVPLITERVYSFLKSYVFVSVPMFVLMAAILDRSGIARDLFDAMKPIAGNLRGGVAIQTIFVSVILAAMSGIEDAELAELASQALPLGPSGRTEFRWAVGDRGPGDGAARGTRTPDPRITNAMLYQLSYCGYPGLYRLRH